VNRGSCFSHVISYSPRDLSPSHQILEPEAHDFRTIVAQRSTATVVLNRLRREQIIVKRSVPSWFSHIFFLMSNHLLITGKGVCGPTIMNASTTSTRDRVPFPPSVQQSPSSKRLLSTSSGSSLPPNGPILPSQSITLDSILATHADAPSPPLAALQQILNERNAFSAHNAQLWKLVEKQRAAYTQILKELERVRSERDLYKNRVSAMGGKFDKEKKKDAERASKQPSPASEFAISDKSGPNSAEEQGKHHRHKQRVLSRREVILVY
jgi:hypothetical protein